MNGRNFVVEREGVAGLNFCAGALLPKGERKGGEKGREGGSKG